jgi:hypothetical protein
VSEDPFLSRWSRLKKTARAAPGSADVAPKAEVRPAPAVPPPHPPAASRADAQGEPAPLPPVESLTPESDFSPFMGAKVDESLKRRALKTLFQDPRFNVMDGLDTYIADYSQPDPLPDGWLEKMGQLAHLGDRPARLEEERRAAEEARAAAEESPTPVRNSVSNDHPALPASDTSAAVDEAPTVVQSQTDEDRLS